MDDIRKLVAALVEATRSNPVTLDTAEFQHLAAKVSLISWGFVAMCRLLQSVPCLDEVWGFGGCRSPTGINLKNICVYAEFLFKCD